MIVDRPQDSTESEEHVRTTMTTMTKVLLAVIMGALCATVPSAAAFAHNSLAGSTPENGATVDRAPERVSLTFLGKLDPAKTSVTIAGPDGNPAATGDPKIDGRSVTIGLNPGAPGQYVVSYEVGSDDGHPVKGKIRFTATNGVAPSPSPSPSSASPSASPSPVLDSAAPTTTGPAVDLASQDGLSRWPVAVGVIVVLLVAATAVTVWVRRRRTAG